MYILSWKRAKFEYFRSDFGIVEKQGGKPDLTVYEFEISNIIEKWASPANGIYALIYAPPCFIEGFLNHTLDKLHYPNNSNYYQSGDSPYDYENPIIIIPIPERLTSLSRKAGKAEFTGQPLYSYGMQNNSFLFQYVQDDPSSYGAFMSITPAYQEQTNVEIPGESYTQSGALTNFPWSSTDKVITGYDGNDNARPSITNFDIILLGQYQI